MTTVWPSLRQLGHASPATTARYLADLNPADLVKHMEAFSNKDAAKVNTMI